MMEKSIFLKKVEKFKSFLKKEYLTSWNYFKESRKFIYSIVGIFCFFSLIGFFIPAPDYISDQILKFVEELLEQTKGMSHFEMINFIFLNNLQSSFFGMVYGAIFGVFPIIAAIVNGYLLGFISFKVVNVGGFLVLWRLFPHGIFELPAVFISLGMGLKLGTFILKDEKIESFKKFFLNSLKVFLFIVLPLLIVAAIIEGSLIFILK